MKLTFKDLKQQKFIVEADPSETIGQVKQRISAEKGWEAGLQKLIYSGKILADANTVESYNIEEKGFIVCMVSKPKTQPVASSSTTNPPSTPTPVTAQTPAAPAAPVPASHNASNPPATPTPAGPTASEGESFNDPSALALGAQRDSAIANMESMGFPRADIDRAMRAAFYNPDRAVEYLLNGIPENVQAEQRQGGGSADSRATPASANNPASPAPATGGGAAPAMGGEGADQPINLFEAAAQAGRGGSGGRSGRSGGGGADATGAANIGALGEAMGAAAAAGNQGGGEEGRRLDFLRTIPQFQQLRQIVQTQPRMLEPILQQVGAGNPQLAALIGQHPDQFLALLSEDADGDAALPPGAQEVSVTEDERDAIERLCRLGFERDLVVQAYFACDKNEELAANFLFDQPDEGEGGEGGA